MLVGNSQALLARIYILLTPARFTGQLSLRGSVVGEDGLGGCGSTISRCGRGIGVGRSFDAYVELAAVYVVAADALEEDFNALVLLDPVPLKELIWLGVGNKAMGAVVVVVDAL